MRKLTKPMIIAAEFEAHAENERRDSDARHERLMDFLHALNRTELRNMSPSEKWAEWRVAGETKAYEEHRARGWVVPSTVIEFNPPMWWPIRLENGTVERMAVLGSDVSRTTYAENMIVVRTPLGPRMLPESRLA